MSSQQNQHSQYAPYPVKFQFASPGEYNVNFRLKINGTAIPPQQPLQFHHCVTPQQHEAAPRPREFIVSPQTLCQHHYANVSSCLDCMSFMEGRSIVGNAGSFNQSNEEKPLSKLNLSDSQQDCCVIL